MISGYKEFIVPLSPGELRDLLVNRPGNETCRQSNQRDSPAIVGREVNGKIMLRRGTLSLLHIPFTLPELHCSIESSQTESILKATAKPSIWSHILFGLVFLPLIMIVSPIVGLFWCFAGCFDVFMFACLHGELIAYSLRYEAFSQNRARKGAFRLSLSKTPSARKL